MTESNELINLPLFQCCESGMIYSESRSSFEFFVFRIQIQFRIRIRIQPIWFSLFGYKLKKHFRISNKNLSTNCHFIHRIHRPKSRKKVFFHLFFNFLLDQWFWIRIQPKVPDPCGSYSPQHCMLCLYKDNVLMLYSKK